MIEKLKDLGDRAKITIGMEKSRPLMSQDAKCCSIIILSCSFFSLSSLFTDFIDNVPVTEILWWRFFLCTVTCIFYNQFTAQPRLALTAWKDRQLLLSALFGTITASCTVFALRQLPIGEATLLLTTAPVFTVLLSSFFLKEQLQISDFASLIVATGGVIFVAQPDFLFGGSEHGPARTPIFYLAIAAALTRGFFKAAKYVAVSVTSNSTSVHVIVLYLSSMGLTALTLINTYMALSASGEGVSKREFVGIPTSSNFLFMLLMSSFYFLQQICVCTAMRYGKPAKTSLLKYFDIVLPFLFQVTIFKLYPNRWSLSGCALIMVSMLTVIIMPRGDDKSSKTLPIHSTDSPKVGKYTILKNQDD